MNNLKFTQEIKDKWLEALKSGEYEQGFGSLIHEDLTEGKVYYCCIGVLGEIHPELSNEENDNSKSNPYTFLDDNYIDHSRIYTINDDREYVNKVRKGEQKRDYSNVIPVIEQLPIES